MMGRRHRLWIFLALLSQFVAGCSGLASTDDDASSVDAEIVEGVPMARGNPAGTGVQPGPAPDLNQELTLQWFWPNKRVDGPIEVGQEDLPPSFSSPAVVNGVLYANSSDGYLYAFEAATGEEKWSFELVDLAIPGSDERAPITNPAVAAGFVYAAGSDGRLFAIDATSGAEMWQFQGDNSEGGAESLVVADGTVYMSWDSILYAVDAETGEEVWRFEPSGDPEEELTAPTVANGIVLVGGISLWALDASSGEEIWRFQDKIVDYVDEYFSAAASDGLAFVISDESILYSVNIDDGSERWRFRFEGIGYDGP